MSGHVFFDILNNLKKGLCLSIFSRKKHDPHSLFLQVYNFIEFKRWIGFDPKLDSRMINGLQI